MRLPTLEVYKTNVNLQMSSIMFGGLFLPRPREGRVCRVFLGNLQHQPYGFASMKRLLSLTDRYETPIIILVSDELAVRRGQSYHDDRQIRYSSTCDMTRGKRTEGVIILVSATRFKN